MQAPSQQTRCLDLRTRASHNAPKQHGRACRVQQLCQMRAMDIVAAVPAVAQHWRGFAELRTKWRALQERQALLQRS